MYKVGEKIVFVDEAGHGIVKEVKSNGLLLVEDEHGFQRTYLKSQVTRITVPQEKLSVISQVPKEKAVLKPLRVAEKHNALPEVLDLHIHELVSHHENWSNTQIVDYQMQFLISQLALLMKRRVKVVHIIHGVGEGVLRNEVRSYLRKFVNCEINDLSYTRNGFGATEFVIRYKGNV
jgi:dsDNA-specific endonuclease/ATPase MutS2